MRSAWPWRRREGTGTLYRAGLLCQNPPASAAGEREVTIADWVADCVMSCVFLASGGGAAGGRHYRMSASADSSASSWNLRGWRNMLPAGYLLL